MNVIVAKNPYPLLKDIVLSENKKELLYDYLKKEWYNGPANVCQAWHESHKSKANIYVGYWSFEAGAFAKIFGMDDQDLKDVSYYPYDLAHYTE